MFQKRRNISTWKTSLVSDTFGNWNNQQHRYIFRCEAYADWRHDHDCFIKYNLCLHLWKNLPEGTNIENQFT